MKSKKLDTWYRKVNNAKRKEAKKVQREKEKMWTTLKDGVPVKPRPPRPPWDHFAGMPTGTRLMFLAGPTSGKSFFYQNYLSTFNYDKEKTICNVESQTE